MKKTSQKKEKLIDHIRKSSIEQIHKELVEAGLYTYETTKNVINSGKIKVALRSEERLALKDDIMSYKDYKNSSSNPDTYSLAS